MYYKVSILFFLIISLSFSQDPKPTDSSFAEQFVGSYQCDDETVTIESKGTYLRAVDGKGKVYHFLWLKNLKFNIQNSQKNIRFKKQAGLIRSFKVKTRKRTKIFTKVS